MQNPFKIPDKIRKNRTLMPSPRRKADRVEHKWRVCTDWYMADAICDALDNSPVGTDVVICTWSAGVTQINQVADHPRRGPTTIYLDHSNTARSHKILEAAHKLGTVCLRHVHAKCAVVGDYVIISSSNLSRCRGAELTELFKCEDTADWLKGQLAEALPENKAVQADARRGAKL